jgi:hypothetical protein
MPMWFDSVGTYALLLRKILKQCALTEAAFRRLYR